MDLGKAPKGKDRKAVAQNVFQLVRFVKGIKKRLYEYRRRKKRSIAGDIGQASDFTCFSLFFFFFSFSQKVNCEWILNVMTYNTSIQVNTRKRKGHDKEYS